VRGSRQGESHGGVYLVDFASQRAVRTVDWDTMNIDWQGRGWDRGLRGIGRQSEGRADSDRCARYGGPVGDR
jgi:hypothetical protein